MNSLHAPAAALAAAAAACFYANDQVTGAAQGAQLKAPVKPTRRGEWVAGPVVGRERKGVT